MHIDLKSLLQTIGYLGLFGIIFAESGIFLAFFLPGDSLLFTAGILASQGFFSLGIVMVLVGIAAISGGFLAYYIGYQTEEYLFHRKGSFFFQPHHMEKTKKFFALYGDWAIIAARFIPIIRTFAPVIAGTSEMSLKKFVPANIIGGILWAVAMPAVGYFLGSRVPNIEHYITPVLLGVIILSFVPILWRFFKKRSV